MFVLTDMVRECPLLVAVVAVEVVEVGRDMAAAPGVYASALQPSGGTLATDDGHAWCCGVTDPGNVCQAGCYPQCRSRLLFVV